MSKKRKAVFFGAIAVMIAAAMFIAIYLIRQHSNNDIYKDLQDKVNVSPEEDIPPSQPPADPVGSDNPEPPEEPYVSPIDFETLWEINEDIYAWLDIPGTEIQYPIVQSATDNTYYLEHTIEGKSGLPGSIYTENVNAKDFSDFLTTIYGHNMGNGTMFGNIKKFRSLNYMDEHPVIDIYTAEDVLHYRVFGAVTYSNTYLPKAFDYATQEGRQAFLDSIYGIREMNSYVRDDVEVTPDSHIIILSTCMGDSSVRCLVLAVLEEDTPAE